MPVELARMPEKPFWVCSIASEGSVRRSKGDLRAMAAAEGGECTGVTDWLSRTSWTGGEKSADGAAKVSPGKGLAITGDRSDTGRWSLGGAALGRWMGLGGRLNSPVMSSRGRSIGGADSSECAGVFPEFGSSRRDRGSWVGRAGPDSIEEVEARRVEGGGTVARSSRWISPGATRSLSGDLTGRAGGRVGTGGMDDGPAASGSIAGRTACLGVAGLEPSMICFTTLRGNPIVLISLSSLGSAMTPPPRNFPVLSPLGPARRRSYDSSLEPSPPGVSSLTLSRLLDYTHRRSTWSKSGEG